LTIEDVTPIPVLFPSHQMSSLTPILQGKYAKAESLYQQALSIFKRALGPDHPFVAITCENLAKCYKELGKEDEAVIYEECWKKIRLERARKTTPEN
jgi:lipopolysaccharide biosynthesis regulator YciM